MADAMGSSRRAGRPAGGDSDARQTLIDSARRLMVRLPYDKVSTRMIAERAGVNVAMIRYYFGNKAGLFEAMLEDTLAPMQEGMRRVLNQQQAFNFTDMMRTYYHTMIPQPEFPRMIARLMDSPEDDPARQMLFKHMDQFLVPMKQMAMRHIPNLRDGVDPQLAKFSCMSLMIFPFLMPTTAYKKNGIERNEQFLMQLLEHNLRLLEHGMLTPLQENS